MAYMLTFASCRQHKEVSQTNSLGLEAGSRGSRYFHRPILKPHHTGLDNIECRDMRSLLNGYVSTNEVSATRDPGGRGDTFQVGRDDQAH
jgi:hypothetical protein